MEIIKQFILPVDSLVSLILLNVAMMNHMITSWI